MDTFVVSLQAHETDELDHTLKVVEHSHITDTLEVTEHVFDWNYQILTSILLLNFLVVDDGLPHLWLVSFFNSYENMRELFFFQEQVTNVVLICRDGFTVALAEC
jgi:hypothetical protein